MNVVFTAEVDLEVVAADHMPEDKETACKELAEMLERHLAGPGLNVRAKITRVWED